MIDQLWEYTISLYKAVPIFVYIGLFIMLCTGLIVILGIWGIRRGWSKICLLVLIEYVFLLFGSTVIFRNSSEAISGHNFYPLWSYRAYLSGEDPQLLPENIMNVVVFIPVGLVIGTQLLQKMQKGWLVAMMVGAGISVSIEVMQFFMNRGFSEVDDMMHNALGCVIGYEVYRVICSILLKFRG